VISLLSGSFHSRFSSQAISKRRARSEAKIDRIWVNWSDGAVVATSDDKPIGTHYFMVAWRPPQHFELVAVELKPRAGCTGGPPGSREFASR